MKALIYNLPATTEEGRATQGILRAMGAHFEECDASVLGEKKLSEVLGVTEDDLDPAAPKIPCPMDYQTAVEERRREAEEATAIFFHDFGQEGISLFLRAYKETGKPPIRLKSMVTPVNHRWLMGDLILELIEEDCFMKAYHELYHFYQVAEAELKKGDYTEGSREQVAAVLEDADALRSRIEQRDASVTPEMIRAQARALAQALEGLVPEV